MTDFTVLPLAELKKHGFMRYGTEPIPNLWLLPGALAKDLASGQTLYGIDGKPYVVGKDAIDHTELFGYLAYGVKVAEDTNPGLPEIDPKKLPTGKIDRRERRKAERRAAKNHGAFLR